jgi:hypothetical protein
MSVGVWVVGLLAGAATVGLAAAAFAAERNLPEANVDEANMRKKARKLRKDVLAAAAKWAAARGLPLQWVLATILRESGGDPKAQNKSAKEDSRGPMQVNVRAHPKFANVNLYDADKGIEAGTEIMAGRLKTLREHLAKCAAPLAYSEDVYLRLAYALPVPVYEMLDKAKSRTDTVHPFKDAEVYVERWGNAMRAVRAEGLA